MTTLTTATGHLIGCGICGDIHVLEERKDKLTQDWAAPGGMLEMKRLAHGFVNIDRFTSHSHDSLIVTLALLYQFLNN